MESSLPLEGLYLYLVRNGFPLSVRDYQDALTALRGEHGLYNRTRLQWLCQTLWARTEQEVSRLDRLFRDFPMPSAEVVKELSGRGDGPDRPRRARQRGKETEKERVQEREREGEAPVIEFTSPSQSGIGLPRAQLSEPLRQAHIFTPRPLVRLRALIIAWRRFRRAQRSGPRVELDIEATIAEQCRRGTLNAPVLIPARRNQARLILLIDASPSMVIWRPMNRLWAESLERSQLAHTALYFFDNSPGEGLFDSETLTRPLVLNNLLDRHDQCAVLVISDAGAARGRRNRARVKEDSAFLTAVKRAWHPIAWLNPMPRARWGGTSAELVERLPGAGMFQLDDDGLTQAIDFIRGKRGR